MRHIILVLILAAALLVSAGCSYRVTEASRLNPGQEPAVYTANRWWVQSQYRQRFDSNEWHYSWQDPKTKAIYLCYDTNDRQRRRECAKYGVALP